ncbi:MAG: type II secretion system protein M [Pseudomonadota bacterium]
MKAWFLKFPLRDQIALLALAAAVSLYVIFMLMVIPLGSAREELARSNASTAEQLKRVDLMAAEIKALRGSGAASPSSPNRNLTALLNGSANRYQLSITRLQPNSRGAVQLRFERAPLDQLLRWIHELETGESLLVEELSVSQTGNAGVVSASLRVAGL